MISTTHTCMYVYTHVQNSQQQQKPVITLGLPTKRAPPRPPTISSSSTADIALLSCRKSALQSSPLFPPLNPPARAKGLVRSSVVRLGRVTKTLLMGCDGCASSGEVAQSGRLGVARGQVEREGWLEGRVEGGGLAGRCSVFWVEK